MKKFLIVLVCLFSFLSCAYKSLTLPTTIDTIIEISDRWWKSVQNENPHYYRVIDLGSIIFHLCSSRAKLWVEYNKLYPDNPFDLQSNTYMFTTHDPHLSSTHMWLIVKVKNDKVILHKWAIGHELIRLLSCYTNDLLNANDY